jgi:hypothetical protein
MSKGKICYICSSDKYVDEHHYDCLRGQLSPETVPLCRRCHTTYHTWGVGAFSPDTTAKALDVENKRREMIRSLPPDHPQRRRAEHLGILKPLKLEDVRRSRYWYKKWGISLPRKERAKANKILPVKLPNNPPLCGDNWLREHLHDYSPEEIGSLSIEIGYDSKWLPSVALASGKRKVKAAIRSLSDAYSTGACE